MTKLKGLKFNMHQRTKTALLIGVLGIGLLLLSIAYIEKGNAGGLQDALLSINGVPVPEEEFKLLLQDEKAATASYFARLYDAEYSSEFWNTVYGEEVPLEVARTNALNKLIRIKVEQHAAVEYGIIKSSRFSALRHAMEKEEKSSYGADGLNFFQEYMLFHSKLVLDAKNQFKASAAETPEEQLREYYESQKQESFQSPDDLTVWQISWVSEETEEEQELVEQLLEDVQQGMSIEQLLPKYKRLHSLQAQEKLYGSNEGRDENSSELGMTLKQQAYQLKQGQMSDLLQYGQQYFVLICSERSEGEIKSFEEVSLLIEDVIREEKFDNAIQRAASAAVVVFNQEKWNALKME